MKPTWKKYLLYGSVIVVGVTLLYILEETVRLKNTGFEAKTLWDWMEVFFVPGIVALLIAYIESRERKQEREITLDRQQEAALQAYIDHISDLLLNKNLRASIDETDEIHGNISEVRHTARIMTLTVLRGLDPRRKGLVIQFLFEAGLISGENPIVRMYGASLQDAELDHAFLDGANLSGAVLRDAKLRHAVLMGAKLNGAKLIGAHMGNITLRGANLEAADLTGADLTHANLMNTNLRHANLSQANLTDAWNIFNYELEDTFEINLKGAIMPDGTKHD